MAAPDIEISELPSIVENDPGLTEVLLHAANPDACSPPSCATTALGAVMRVGLSTTKRIVASATLNGALKNVGRSGIGVDQL